MGSIVQRSFSIDYVAYDDLDDPKWVQYDIKLDKKNSNSSYCKAIFPKGWTCKLIKGGHADNYRERAIYYDEDYVPRIECYSHYWKEDKKAAIFLRIDKSIEILETELKELHDEKDTIASNKKCIDYISTMLSPDEKDNCYVIYAYAVGNKINGLSLVGFYNNIRSVEVILSNLEKCFPGYIFRCENINDEIMKKIDNKKFIDNIEVEFKNQDKLNSISEIIQDLKTHCVTRQYLIRSKMDIVIDV